MTGLYVMVILLCLVSIIQRRLVGTLYKVPLIKFILNDFLGFIDNSMVVCVEDDGLGLLGSLQTLTRFGSYRWRLGQQISL